MSESYIIPISKKRSIITKSLNKSTGLYTIIDYLIIKSVKLEGVTQKTQRM